MERKTSTKQLIIYLICAFGLAWPIQALASHFVNQGNTMLFQLLLSVCMYVPLLATLIARIPFRGMGWVPHLKGRLRYLFFSLWMPFVISLLCALFYFLCFPEQYDSNFDMFRQMLGEQGVAQLEAQGLTVQAAVILSMISAITTQPFFVMLLALGEEVGWRGALYPMLKEQFGKNQGRILGGICWGVWHWPVIILAGYEYGKEYPGAPFLGPVTFCISTIFVGMLHDYVYEKSGTIWMPALFHGAINAAGVLAYLLKPDDVDKLIFGPMWIGLVGMIPMAAVAVIVCGFDKKGREGLS